MEKVLNSLTPLDVPKTKDDRLNELQKQLLRTKRVSYHCFNAPRPKFSLKFISSFQDYILSLAHGASFPSSRSNQTSVSKLLRDQQNHQRKIREDIKARVEAITSEIVSEYLNRKPHRAAHTSFAQFPTPEVTRAMKLSA